METDAPKSVEVTVLYHGGKNRYTVNLVNGQETLPAVPVYPMTIRLKLGLLSGKVKVKKIPEGTAVPHTVERRDIGV